MSPRDSFHPPDPRFPSGPWIGFYRQGRLQSRQRLTLTFTDNHIRGFGTDPVGSFTISGSIDPSSGQTSWVKTYTTHIVNYSGLAIEGDGIRGNWSLTTQRNLNTDTGAFQIWPDELAMELARASQNQQPAFTS